MTPSILAYNAKRSPNDDDRARLHVADLVHTLKLAVLREPLLHFLVLGAALFGPFGFVEKRRTDGPTRIVISSTALPTLQTICPYLASSAHQGGIAGLSRTTSVTKMYYREGHVVGLDRDDSSFVAASGKKWNSCRGHLCAKPSEEQLSAYLASHPEDFLTEDRVTFHQVFLSATRRGSSVEDDAKKLGSTLALASDAVETDAIGDPFVLGSGFREMSQSDIARTFGNGFAEQLTVVQPGRWQGPILSSFGAHFVFIEERTKGGLPPLDTVRRAVQREWLNTRRVEAEQALYRSLRERYEIMVEVPKAVESETGQ